MTSDGLKLQENLASIATELTNNGQYVEAWHRWGEIRRLGYDIDSAYILGGYVGIELKNFEESEMLLANAVEKYPANCYAHLFYADCARRAGNLDVAADRLLGLLGITADDNVYDYVMDFLLVAPSIDISNKLMAILLDERVSRSKPPYLVKKLNSWIEANPPAADKIVGAYLASLESPLEVSNFGVSKMMRLLCLHNLQDDEVEDIARSLILDLDVEYIYQIFNSRNINYGRVLSKIISKLLSEREGSAQNLFTNRTYALLASFYPEGIPSFFESIRLLIANDAMHALKSCVAVGAVASLRGVSPLPYVNRRLRVAVCVSGQLRGFEHAMPSWDQLGLHEHDCDFFVHTWSNIGRKFPVPQHAERVLSGRFLSAYRDAFTRLGESCFRQEYWNLTRLFTSGEDVNHSKICDFYNTDFVVLEDEKERRFDGFNNFEKMYYKIKMCYRLAIMAGKDYDLFIRIRPDLALATATFPLRDLGGRIRRDNLVLVDSGPYIHPEVGHVVGDQFAVASPIGMDAYAATYDNTKHSSEGFLADISRSFRPHVNLAESLIVSGFAASSNHGIEFGGLREPSAIALSEINAAIRRDLETRSANEWDEILLNASVG